MCFGGAALFSGATLFDGDLQLIQHETARIFTSAL